MARASTRLTALLLGAAAMTFLPLSQLAGIGLGKLDGVTSAYAKNGGGGGGGGGGNGGNGGNGGGGGHGNGGNGGGHGNSGGGKGGGSSQTRSTGGHKSSDSKVKKSQKSTATDTSTKGKPAKQTVAKAALPKEKPEQNLSAKLGGLNSLKRNINGLMNSQDPRMALMREYMTNYMAYEDAQKEIADLQDQQDALDPADPDYQAKFDALQEEIDAAKAEADAAGGLVTEDAFKEALLAAANPNKVAAYGGPEGYLTDDVVGWAEDTLGVTPTENPEETGITDEGGGTDVTDQKGGDGTDVTDEDGGTDVTDEDGGDDQGVTDDDGGTEVTDETDDGDDTDVSGGDDGDTGETGAVMVLPASR